MSGSSSYVQNWKHLLHWCQNKKVKQCRDRGLHFCSGVPYITVSRLGFPVCRPKQNKTKKRRRKSSSKYCLVLHFPFCFLIRVSMVSECRENLKSLCLLRISTKPDAYQHLSPANSLSGLQRRGRSHSLVPRRGGSGFSCRCGPRVLAPSVGTWFSCSSPCKRRKQEVCPMFRDGLCVG